MKKFIFLSIFAVLTMSASAVIMPATYTNGTITFRDGHEETYEQVALPNRWTEKIGVKESKKDKKAVTLSAKDIRYITYWAADFPENKTTVYCLLIPDQKKKDKLYCEWGVPHMASEWGVVFHSHEFYQMNQKTGEMNMLVYLEGQSFEALAKPQLEIWQPLLLLRSGMEEAIFVGNIRHYTDRKTKEKVAEYSWPSEKVKEGAIIFKENQDVYQQILDGTLKASDLQYILDKMQYTVKY